MSSTDLTYIAALCILFLLVFLLTCLLVEPAIYKLVRWWRSRGDDE